VVGERAVNLQYLTGGFQNLIKYTYLNHIIKMKGRPVQSIPDNPVIELEATGTFLSEDSKTLFIDEIFASCPRSR
jgi:hypothetical protein